MKKSSIVVMCLILIVLVIVFRPRRIESVILSNHMNSEIVITSIKKIDKGNLELINLDDYDTSGVIDDIGSMIVIPYPWGRDMEVEYHKPYYIVRLQVGDQEISIDVYSNQIGIDSKNYWVWKKELIRFELDHYKLN